MTPRKIYLDHNSTTPVASTVIEAVHRYLQEVTGNPSSIHAFGREARTHLSRSRSLIANYLGVRNDEIIFTSGGTEGANLVIRGIFEGSRGNHIITSSIEHPCVYDTIRFLESKGAEVSYLDVGSLGAPTVDQVQNAIRSDTCLIAIMGANNETGVKADISEIAEVAKLRNIAFFVDGVALLGREEITIPHGVSAISFSGHKIHAPQGVGFCYLRRKTPFSSLITGGGQQFGKRAGTENLPGIVGLAEAVRLFDEEMPEGSKRMRLLRDRFEASILSALPDVLINGEGDRIPNTSNLFFPGVNGETLLQKLDFEGIAASHGSACSSGGLEPSRVLLEMGYPKERVLSSIRFSLSRYTSGEEISIAADVIVKTVRKLLP